MSELIVVAYPAEETAERALDALNRLSEAQHVDLADACYVTKGPDGGVKLHQALRPTPAGTALEALRGALTGAFFLMPLTGMIVGAASGVLAGRLADYGIDDGLIRSLSQALQPGTSALFVLVREADPDRVLPEIGAFGGTLLQTSLSAEQEARLRAALASGPAAAPPDSIA